MDEWPVDVECTDKRFSRDPCSLSWATGTRTAHVSEVGTRIATRVSESFRGIRIEYDVFEGITRSRTPGLL